jgi:NAD(P)H dehydrogenase (quinone)
MTIAVTGATGQLGGLILESLRRDHPTADLVAVVRDAGKAAPLADAGIAVRVAAYDDRAALETALVGVETLMLVSGSEVGRRVDQHRNVIDAAGAAGVGRIVYSSAPGATDTTLVLAPEHAATEDYLTASGLGYTIGRVNWYTENYAPQIAAVRETGTLVAAAGDGRVASATRRDFAEGFAALLSSDDHRDEVLELTGDVAWTFDDLAAALSPLAGREVVYQPVDAPTLVRRLVAAGLDEGTAGFVAALDTNIAEGTLGRATPTLSTLIGRPTTPLGEALAALA